MAEGPRTPAQIDNYIENLSHDHPHQFALYLPDLVMQPTHYIVGGIWMVVVHESFPGARPGHRPLVIALQEKPARIAEDFRLQDKRSLQVCRNRVHLLA